MYIEQNYILKWMVEIVKSNYSVYYKKNWKRVENKTLVYLRTPENKFHVKQITLSVSISFYFTLFKILINDIANNYT